MTSFNQVIEQSCYRTQRSSSISNMQVDALPEGVLLGLLDANLNRSWSTTVVHCDVTKAEVCLSTSLGTVSSAVRRKAKNATQHAAHIIVTSGSGALLSHAAFIFVNSSVVIGNLSLDLLPFPLHTS